MARALTCLLRTLSYSDQEILLPKFRIREAKNWWHGADHTRGTRLTFAEKGAQRFCVIAIACALV